MTPIMTDAERSAGLTQPLPAGEELLWQAKPTARVLTRSVFHLKGIAVYFTIAATIVLLVALGQGRPVGQGIALVTLLVPFALIGMGLLSLVGRASARATTYTLTNRRVILHIGVAYEMTVSIPLSAIVDASFRPGRDGHGDIALKVKDRGHTGYVALWPHVRPGHYLQPRPMLRAVADAATVCETFGDALVAFNAGGRRPPQPVAMPEYAQAVAA